MNISLVKQAWLAVLFICLSGCSKKDVAYYQLHVDEAKTKLVECSYNHFSASMIPNELTDLIFQDTECEAARNARLLEKNQQQQLLQRRDDHQSRGEYEIKQRQVLALSYPAFIELKSTCGWSDVSLACQLVNDVDDDMFASEVARLKQTHPVAELNKVKKTPCRGGVDYVQALCHVAEVAFGQLQTQQISYYLANQSAFKQDYNACRVALLANDAVNDDAAISRFMRLDPGCALVKKAANLIGVHSFSQPL